MYNVLAIMAYLIGTIDADSGWPARVIDLIDLFPASTHLTMESMGVPEAWSTLKLWTLTSHA